MKKICEKFDNQEPIIKEELKEIDNKSYTPHEIFDIYSIDIRKRKFFDKIIEMKNNIIMNDNINTNIL